LDQDVFGGKLSDTPSYKDVVFSSELGAADVAISRHASELAFEFEVLTRLPTTRLSLALAQCPPLPPPLDLADGCRRIPRLT
jgi:hypothetical protein